VDGEKVSVPFQGSGVELGVPEESGASTPASWRGFERFESGEVGKGGQGRQNRSRHSKIFEN